MLLATHLRGFRCSGFSLALAALAALAAGCTGRQTADQALDTALKVNGGQREPTAKFSGTVQIDGMPPGDTRPAVTLIILYDPKNPPTPTRLPMYAVCNPDDGSFEFTTYDKGDGVPTGSYIVLFAQMEQVMMMNRGFYPPDKLKNLYNDPDTSKFKVEVTAPGKSDWLFELEVQGKNSNNSPGPKAIKEIRLGSTGFRRDGWPSAVPTLDAPLRRRTNGTV
jgi:hypothetical protein